MPRVQLVVFVYWDDEKSPATSFTLRPILLCADALESGLTPIVFQRQGNCICRCPHVFSLSRFAEFRSNVVLFVDEQVGATLALVRFEKICREPPAVRGNAHQEGR